MQMRLSLRRFWALGVAALLGFRCVGALRADSVGHHTFFDGGWGQARGIESKFSHSGNPAATSFSVVARAWLGELPYLSSWLSHYESIGVEHVLLVVTESEHAEDIHAYLGRRGYHTVNRTHEGTSKLRLASPSSKATVDIATDKSVERAANPKPLIDWIPLGSFEWHFLGNLTESFTSDYLIAIDPDEYLVPQAVDGTSTLQDLVVKAGHPDVITFSWQLVPYADDGDGLAPPYKGLQNVNQKYMVSRKSFGFLGDETYKPEWNEGEHKANGLKCRPDCKIVHVGDILIHFHYRGIIDALIKDVGLWKSEGAEGAYKCLVEGEPTKRLKMMAFSTRLVQLNGSTLDYGRFSPRLEIDKVAESFVWTSYVYPLIGGSSGWSPTQGLERFRRAYGSFRGLLSESDVWLRLQPWAQLKPNEYGIKLEETTLRKLQEEHDRFLKEEKFGH